MYCGDETGSFVGQVGCAVSRFGYGGDESPRVVVPSYVGRYDTDPDSKPFVPASCYRRRWAEANIWKTPLAEPKFGESSRADDDEQTNDNVAKDESHYHRPLVDPAAYLAQGGAIVDWEAYETLWQSAMETMAVRRLKHSTGDFSISSKKQPKAPSSVPASSTVRPTAPEYTCMHPLLAITSGFTYPSLAPDGSYSSTAVQAARRRERVQLVEMLLEKFDAPACFISPEPMVQAFSQGRSTALVVDVGAGGTRVTPVVDGLILSTAQRRSGRGSNWLMNTAWQALLPVTPLRPRYQLQHGVVDPSITAKRGIFHRWAMQDLLWECTSTVRRLPPSGPATVVFEATQRSKKKGNEGDVGMEDDEEDRSGDEGSNDDSDSPMETDEPVSAVPSATYELPDGTLINLTSTVGRDVCRIPEAYFAEVLPFGTTANQSILHQHYTLCDLPLDRLIQSSLLAVADVDVRKDLSSNILLVGGASLGLEERLSWQLRQLLPGKPKVLASAHEIERTAAGWIGGSILSSLGSFQQLWLGRTEYEEYGATLALQRFPV